MSNVGELRPAGGPSPRRGKDTFPLKLYRVLQNPVYSDIIRWCPDQISFTIVDEDAFVQKVMGDMCNTGNFGSFIKQLNMYRFKRECRKSRTAKGEIPKKQASTIYHLDGLFVKGKEELAGTIKFGSGTGSGQSLLEQRLRAALRAAEADRDSLSQQVWSLRIDNQALLQSNSDLRSELQSMKQRSKVLPTPHRAQGRTPSFPMPTSSSPSSSHSGAPFGLHYSSPADLRAHGNGPTNLPPTLAPGATPTTEASALEDMGWCPSTSNLPPRYPVHDAKDPHPVATRHDHFQDARIFDDEAVPAQRDAYNGRPNSVAYVPSKGGMVSISDVHVAPMVDVPSSQEEDERQQPLSDSVLPNNSTKNTTYTHALGTINETPLPIQDNGGWMGAARLFEIPLESSLHLVKSLF